jgi:hypothetical protein
MLCSLLSRPFLFPIVSIVSKDKKHVLSIGEYQGVKTIDPQHFIEHVMKGEAKAA